MGNRTIKEDCIFFHGERWMEGYMKFCTNDLVCSQDEIGTMLEFDCTACPYYYSIGDTKKLIKEMLRKENESRE